MKKSSDKQSKMKQQGSINGKRLKKLYELSMMISGDPSDVFKHAVRTIGELFEVRVVCLSEIRGDKLYFTNVYIHGEVIVDAGNCPLETTPCATVEQTKDVHFYDCVAEKFPKASFLKQHKAHAYCGFPILNSTGDVIAVTCLLDDKPHIFSEEDQELLRIFGQRIAMEMEREAHLTEKKKAEEALHEREEHYRRLVETARAVPWKLDVATLRFTYVGPQAVELLGYPVEKWYEENFWLERLHPEDCEWATRFYRERIAKCENHDFEYRVQASDGRTVWIRDSVNRTQDRDTPKVLQGFMFDITRRKNAENELLVSEKRLRDLFEDANDLFHIVSPDGTLLYVNRAWRETLGYREEEAIGMALFDIIHPDFQEHCIKMFQSIMKGEKSDYVQTKVLAKDGKAVLLEGSCNCHLLDGRPVAAHSIFRDITKKQYMEDELLKIRKLESIGVLAGGIAHDFNNIMTGVLGNISLARLFTAPGNKLHNILAQAENASLKARDLTQQLLTFSKGGAPIRETASIIDLIKDSAGFALKGSNVRCDFAIASDLKAVEVDEGQVSQVISNLIINADQATPQGGAITVTAENIKLNNGNNLPLKKGEYIRLIIKDNGKGISEKDLARIFDPYFTTKDEGNGLGLATTYSIVKRHDGHIQVESEVGVGTAFTIYLPASDNEIKRFTQKPKKPVTGQGRILLMDDEEIVRKAAGEMLTCLGYEITSVRDGTKAIKAYQESQESGRPFDLVIMDLTIPGEMGGKEAIQKLLEIDPEAKAIVSSGYSNDPIMANYKEYGFKERVTKPYKIQELSSSILKALSDSGVQSNRGAGGCC